ncbi:hypothetical protein G4G28_21615 [Massilia sp. Dwa41.01b]|uniref:hypothetical protein n=1 Tax=unclassified Massilia TaxID=2609279 RepID=UPI0015FF38CC|nr:MULTISPECIES: hypothetical protein [unclassified Massilia]QNA90443.1 hypothetical protein G4G28_21615 [Massilia sp. Dwa41.01b]QNA97674.1 hypothetical protein G4G31_00700 [Massilia sp. Se16.2.3]
MKKYGISILAALAILSGCSTIGPTDSPEFATLVQAPVPKGDGAVRFFGAAFWYPNQRGFTDVRNGMLSGTPTQIAGALVVADKAILFEQWDDKAKSYDIVKRIPVDDIMSVNVDSMGLGRRVVVRHKDFSFDSFAFTRPSGHFQDADQTVAAAGYLQKFLKERNGSDASSSALD